MNIRIFTKFHALLLAGAMAVAALSPSANATTVATIDGCYDCVVGDTPSLMFHNTSGGDFINAQMLLKGYGVGTLNNGITQTVLLGTLVGGTTTTYNWSGSLTPGNLASYDYDDEYGGIGYSNAACIVGTFYCANVGNFSVTFTATISGGAFDGQHVFSVFSPDSNQTGGFIGWEGLDPNGISESVYDQHSGSTSTVNGTLANIDIGLPPVTVPEPATLLLTSVALFGMLIVRVRRS